MTFHSITFAIFFAIVVTLYYASPQRWRVPVLLAASTLFYISFIPQYIFILLALITVDYCAGLLIERPQDLLPQFRKPHLFHYANVVSGLQLMAWGMFQKYVVADRLARIVSALYEDQSRLSGPAAAIAAACFSFQIFCDFAGYSDI